MVEQTEREVAEIVSHFQLVGQVVEVTPIVQGHINTTFRVRLQDGSQYTLQSINTYVFRKPEQVMENILAVTEHIKRKVVAAGGDPNRESLNVILTRDGKTMYRDAAGRYWRMYGFIDGVTTYDLVEKPEQMYHAGFGFGKFQNMLSDFEMSSLYETIPNFHNTVWRLENLFQAEKEDKAGRAASVQEELAFFRKRIEDAALLVRLSERGKMPLRVTHNDTKVNNILIDNETNQALCVIDLDTVMPGLAALDFGDSIRYSANTAVEDERDLSKVSLDMELYEQYTKGFLTAVGNNLTEIELEHLPHGAKIVTLETAARFLTDYLDGDVYFHVHRPNQNLDRARCQMQLVRSMEEHFEEMCHIVKVCCSRKS